jgi:ABC-2 type transport system ATP-binding protein
MVPAAITCRSLSRRFGQVQALLPLDLDIPAGSVVGLLGPNGAGKTTTLRMLTGLLRPSTGWAEVAGARIEPEGPARPGPSEGDAAGRPAFGYLDQSPRFYPWMTGRELLRLAADLGGMQRAGGAPISASLQAVGLADAADRRIGGYSGGMLQRLGLAAATLGHPRVVFLDEPLSALDPAGRHEILEVIAGLRGDSTVVMSTHILADVDRVCDRVAILDHGRLIADAPVDDLLARYARPRFEVITEPGQAGPLAALRERLGAEPWVRAIEETADGLVVEAADRAASALPLLAAIVAAGVSTTRVGHLVPTLEDVFLRLVAQDDPGGSDPGMGDPGAGLPGADGAGADAPGGEGTGA